MQKHQHKGTRYSILNNKQINKADVQTQTQRISISEMAFTDVVLAPNQQIGRVFTHEIEEMGQHM